MANVKTTLDTRRAKSDGTFNVIYRITHFKKVYTINSGISVHDIHWNSSKRKISRKHPNSRLLNLKIIRSYYQIEEAILKLDEGFTIEKLREMIGYSTSGSSNFTFKHFAQQQIKQMLEVNRTGNAIVYRTAVNRLIGYAGDDITFKRIDYSLLKKFEHHLAVSGLKQNSISNYFRSIRAIYNKAIKSNVVDRSYYPFYDITIKSEKTSKRAISRDELRILKHIPLDENSTAKRSLNYFLLSFYLRGISFTDLAYLKTSNVINGRVHYKRRKTHKNYSVKLFPKADELINLFTQSDNNYLLPILTNDVPEDGIKAKKIISQWIKTTNKYLKRLALKTECAISITTYTSRHSFATIAKKLGYSKELIAEALGHEYGNKITNIYLDAFDTDVLDDMHYKVVLL